MITINLGTLKFATATSLFADWAFFQMDDKNPRDGKMVRTITSWQIVVANADVRIEHAIVN